MFEEDSQYLGPVAVPCTDWIELETDFQKDFLPYRKYLRKLIRIPELYL